MKVPFLDLSLQHRALRAEALKALEETYDATRFCLGKDVEEFETAFGPCAPRAASLGTTTAIDHAGGTRCQRSGSANRGLSATS